MNPRPEEKTILLEEGYSKVYLDGIRPLIEFVETNKQDFFKTKDFITLYEYAPVLQETRTS